jgi:hypothetical protein
MVPCAWSPRVSWFHARILSAPIQRSILAKVRHLGKGPMKKRLSRGPAIPCPVPERGVYFPRSSSSSSSIDRSMNATPRGAIPVWKGLVALEFVCVLHTHPDLHPRSSHDQLFSTTVRPRVRVVLTQQTRWTSAIRHRDPACVRMSPRTKNRSLESQRISPSCIGSFSWLWRALADCSPCVPDRTSVLLT